MPEPVNMQKVPPLPTISPEKTPSINQGYDRDASRVEKAPSKTTSYAPSKPDLEPPASSEVWRSVNLIRALETLATSHSLKKEEQLDQQFQEIQALHREEAHQLQKALEASQEVSFWSVLEDMTYTVMGAASVYFGATALACGAALTGGMLLTSGILNLGNLLFKHGEIWSYAAEIASCGNEELRKGIETYLPSAIGIMAAAASMYGIYTAWSLPATQSFQSTLSIFQTATSLSAGITSMVRGKSQATLTWLHSDLYALQTKAELSKLDFGKIVVDSTKYQEAQNEIVQLAAKLIRATEQSIQATQQPV